jgi:hypothetical protein
VHDYSQSITQNVPNEFYEPIPNSFRCHLLFCSVPPCTRWLSSAGDTTLRHGFRPHFMVEALSANDDPFPTWPKQNGNLHS